ncbi:MAG: hypothetical protein CMH50_11100 [Myxococcales bacterium]|nr:hypothetical protein [Myxococcales bacterium]
MQMAALVLKKFEVYQQPHGGEYVVVHGRQPGLFAYLLSLIGIDPTTVFKCSSERIEVSQGSFFGQTKMTIPLAAVTGIQAGFTKSKSALYLFVFFTVLGLAGLFEWATAGDTTYGVPAPSPIPGMFLLFLAAIFGLAYVLKKQMSLYVLNGGDKYWGLDFSRSVIEGVKVDIQKVDDTVELINRLVLAQHQQRSG